MSQIIKDKQIYFVIIDYENREEILSKYFMGFDNWIGHWGPLEDIHKYDCVVTHSNSYEDLTGGFDLNIFGDQIHCDLRDVLKRKFPSREINSKNAWDCANQPIGTSILV